MVMIKKCLATGFIIAFGFTCAFNPDEEDANANQKFLVNCQSVGGDAATSLASVNIKQLHQTDSYLWVATWGSGILRIDKNETVVTHKSPNISSNFCSAISGSDTSIMASCYSSSDSKYHLDYYSDNNGTVTWSIDAGGQYTATTNSIINISYDGTYFYAIEDQRNDKSLDLKINATSSNTAKIHRNTSSPTSFTTFNLTSFSATNSGVSMCTTGCTCGSTCTVGAGQLYNRMVTKLTLDRQKDLIGLGDFWDYGGIRGKHSGHVGIEWRHILIWRLESDFTGKSQGGSNTVKPIQIGNAMEVPLAIAYEDITTTNIPFERFYVASNEAVYRVEIENYSQIADATRYTTADGLPSTNARDITVALNQVWLATDNGLATLSSNWSTMNTSNSKLLSNDITAVTGFNGSLWVGTESSLCKVTRRE